MNAEGSSFSSLLHLASLLVDNLLHAHGLAQVNHVLGPVAAFDIQSADANVHARDALGLQRRDGNRQNLGPDRKRVALAGGQLIPNAAINVDVHVLVAGEGRRDRGRVKGGPKDGKSEKTKRPAMSWKS